MIRSSPSRNTYVFMQPEPSALSSAPFVWATPFVGSLPSNDALSTSHASSLSSLTAAESGGAGTASRTSCPFFPKLNTKESDGFSQPSAPPLLGAWKYSLVYPPSTSILRNSCNGLPFALFAFLGNTPLMPHSIPNIRTNTHRMSLSLSSALAPPPPSPFILSMT